MKALIVTLSILISASAFADNKCLALLQDSSPGDTEINWKAVEQAAESKGYQVRDFYSVNNEEIPDYTLIRINTKSMKDAKNQDQQKNIWSEVEVSNLMVSKSALADYMSQRSRNQTGVLVAALNSALPKCKQ
jgi:hypothetical protein